MAQIATATTSSTPYDSPDSSSEITELRQQLRAPRNSEVTPDTSPQLDLGTPLTRGVSLSRNLQRRFTQNGSIDIDTLKKILTKFKYETNNRNMRMAMIFLATMCVLHIAMIIVIETINTFKGGTEHNHSYLILFIMLLVTLTILIITFMSTIVVENIVKRESIIL